MRDSAIATLALTIEVEDVHSGIGGSIQLLAALGKPGLQTLQTFRNSPVIGSVWSGAPRLLTPALQEFDSAIAAISGSTISERLRTILESRLT
jgi:hypothetical protein